MTHHRGTEYPGTDSAGSPDHHHQGHRQGKIVEQEANRVHEKVQITLLSFSFLFRNTNHASSDAHGCSFEG